MQTTSSNYTLGKGAIFLAEFADTDKKIAGGYRQIGNCPDFALKISTTTLDHYSSMTGIRTRDEQVITEVSYTGSITTDNNDLDNMAMFFLGAKSATARASTTITDEAISDVKLDHLHILGATESNPAGNVGIDAATVVLKKGTTTLVAGTDYLIDADIGAITPLSSGSILEGDDLTVSYTARAATINQVISATTPFEGAIFYVATNKTGTKTNYYLPWVKITPDGDYSIIGDSWTEMKFNVEVLTADGKAPIYANGVPVYGA